MDEADARRDLLLDTAWRGIFDAEALDPVQARQTLDEIVNTLLPLADSDADAAYALGYLWYVYPRDEPCASVPTTAESQRWLRKAVSLDPSHAKARLYLGYLAYDCGQIAEARDWLVTVVPAGLGSDMLRVSLAEMLVCCEVRIAGWGAARSALEEFVHCVESATPADVFPKTLSRLLREVPVPHEYQDQVHSMLARADDAAGFATPWLSRESSE